MKSYTVIYKDITGVEKRINIETDNPFQAKYIAFTQHLIPLTSIKRVL